MTAVLQRVLSARVTADGRATGDIGRGLLIYVGAEKGDTEKEAVFLAAKCATLRIFDDENGKMNRNVSDIGGKILAVTNFTLCADSAKGKRPSFDRAERPDRAKELTELFVSACREAGAPVETGVFGADMKVESVNDGPATFILNTRDMPNIGRK